MTIPSWFRMPDSGTRAWQALLTEKQSHRSLFRETRNVAESISPPLNGDNGIWASDKRFLNVLRALAELGEEYPAVIDANGFADHTGVVSDFQSLRNLAGHYMSPMTVPLTNNEALTETLKLAKGFLSERDERIFRELHRYMFRTIVPTSVAMRKQASSGAPFFNSSIELKKKSLALFNEKADDILARFAQGRLEELWLDYKLFFTTYMGVRTQPDAVTKEHGRYKAKEREVADEQYARSAGTLGRRFPADKRVYVDGMLIDDIFAMRRRSVYAYPAAYNYFLTQFFTPLRGFYLEDADFTFKHRSPAEIVEKLCIFESIRGYDVKQFDQSVQPWLLEKFVSEFSGFIREEVLFFFDKVLKQPIYQPHPSVVNAAGEDRPLTEFCPMLGDPFDLSSFTNRVGLPSGIGPNPDIGKFVMTFAYLCLFDRHFADVLEVGVRTILQGKHDRYALLDMTDDAILAVNDKSFWSTAAKFMKEEFYVRIEPEKGVSFLGNIIHHDKAGKLRASPNIVTFLRNRLCPEHGVQHWSRKDFVGTGWVEGKKHYSAAPLFTEVYGKWDDVWRAQFGEGLDVRFNEARLQERHRNVPSLTEADEAVLQDADKLYYRYSIEDIHPWVLDRVVTTISFEDYFPSIERFFV